MNRSIVLVLVALAGVLDQAIGEQLFYDEIEERLPLDSVLETLGNRLHVELGHGAPIRYFYGSKVHELLAQAMDKNDKVILNQYSPNDLIALNEWDSNDCLDDELEKRRKSCEQFTTRGLTSSLTPPSRTKDGYTRLALGYYCWAISDDVEERCPIIRVSFEIGTAMQALVAFKTKVDSAEHWLPVALPDAKLTAVAKTVLAKEEPTIRDTIKRICLIVVDGLGKRGVRLDKEWHGYYQLCERVISSKH